MLLTKFKMNQNKNYIKHGLKKAANFKINQWNQVYIKQNTVQMYSTHNEETFVVPGRFTTTLKNKRNNKYMTSISDNLYIVKWDDIANHYNNTYHIIIKKKPVHLKSSTYVDSGKKNIERSYI